MWRIFLAYATHRALLLCAIFLSLNLNSQSRGLARTIATLPTFGVLWAQLISRVAQTPEVLTLTSYGGLAWNQIFSVTLNPYYWICHILVKWFFISPAISTLIVSNILMLFFLWELHALSNRLTTFDVAKETPIFAILWPTSYELSLGSAFVLNCLLTVGAVRYAIDDRWWLVGLALGALGLIDGHAILLLPLILYYFWFYQRHYQLLQVVKRTVFLLAPLGAVYFFRNLNPLLAFNWHNSALETVYSTALSGNIGWMFSKPLIGQTITFFVFLLGAIVAAITQGEWMYRIVPPFFFILLAGFSPYATLGLRALASSICFQGIVSLSAPWVLKTIKLGLIVLSVMEVMSSF